MKRTMFAVFVIGLISSLGAQEAKTSLSWLSGSLDDALAKAKIQGKMVLVDFTSPG